MTAARIAAAREADRVRALDFIYSLAAGKVLLLMKKRHGGHSLETAVAMVCDEHALDQQRLYKELEAA